MTLPLWFTVLGAMLAMGPVATDIYTLPKLLAVAVGVTAMWVARPPKPKRWLALDAAVLTLLAVVIVTSCTAVDWRVAFYGEHGYYYGSVITAALCALLYFAGKDADLEDLAKAIVTGGVVIAVYAIVQQKFDLLPIQIPDHRSVGTMGSPPFLGCVLAMALPYAMSRRGKLWAILIVLGIAFSESRAAYLAAYVASMVMLFDRKQGMSLRSVLVGLLAICAVMFAGIHSGHGDGLRVQTWTAALRIFLAHPVLGVGPENFTDAFRLVRTDAWLTLTRTYQTVQNHAHNDVLQVAATMGLVGLCAYGWLHYEAWRQLKDGDRAHAAAIVAMLVFGKFDPTPFTAIVLASLIAGVATGAASAGRRQDDPPGLRWHGLIAAGLCLGIISKMFAADVWFHRASAAFVFGDQKAGVEAMRTTLELFPVDPDYRIMAMESLFNLWREKHNPHLLLEAKLQGQAVAAEHPGNVQAQEMAGVAAAMYAVHTQPQGSPRDAAGYDAYADARVALERAVQLDHNSLQAYEVLAQLCAHFRDLAPFEIAVKEIKRISAVAKGNQPGGMICKLCGKPWKEH